MTGGYLAIIGPHADPQLADLFSAMRQVGWVERWRTATVRLFASASLPLHRLEPGPGFVIGRLFDHRGKVASATVALRVGEDWPKELTRSCWGSYVAISEDEAGPTIYRDPSGGLGCYSAMVDRCTMLTSHPHLLFDANLVDPQIDWSIIRAILLDRSARDQRTALQGIVEIQPGSSVQYQQTGSMISSVWDPWTVAEKATSALSVEELSGVLDQTLGAWGTMFRRPVIEVSGGLDSSIVAAGIAAAAVNPMLISFAAASGDPDERFYALALARQLGLPLEIVRPNIAAVDLTLSLSCDLPRPNARAFTQAADALSLAWGQTHHADAFVSGGGGDDVFCYLRSVLPVVDRCRAEGWRLALSTTREIAIMNHATVWDAFHRLLRRARHRPSKVSHFDTRLLAQSDARPTIAELSRLQAGKPLLPGKIQHAAAIASIHNHLEGHARTTFAPIISPLLSQPIVEACLAIPTWRWCEGGRNRAVARQAYAHRLPQLIIERRSKGSFDAFCAQLLHTNRALVRGMLLDGALMERRLLDRAAIELALDDPSPPAAIVSRLLSFVDIESWVSAWTSRQRR